MDEEEFSADVSAQELANGKFTPVLLMRRELAGATEVTRTELGGEYDSELEAIEAGNAAVIQMALGGDS